MRQLYDKHASQCAGKPLSQWPHLTPRHAPLFTLRLTQDTTVYETRSEGHMTRAIFELTDLADTPFLFIAAEVAEHFKLSDGDGQEALRQSGYQTTQKSHKGRKGRYWAHPKHLQKTGCAFSLWTAYRGCPNIRDAPDLSLVTNINTHRLYSRSAECG
jgi:hypothetical protein